MRIQGIAAPGLMLLASLVALTPARAEDSPLPPEVASLAAVAVNPALSGRFWDGDPRRQPTEDATSSAHGTSRRIRTSPATKPLTPDGVLVPELGRDANAAAASCRAVLKDDVAAGLCGEHPAAALVFAGVLDAVKEQFGSVHALSMNVLFMLLGLALAALSGLGLVAKIAVSLLSAGIAIDALQPLLKQGWDAVSKLRSSPEGSADRALAARSIGKASGSVLLMALMVAIGWKASQTGPGQNLSANITAQLGSVLNKTGIAPTAAALEAQIPLPLKAALTKVFGSSPAQAAESRPVAPEPAPAPRPLEELLQILDQRPDRASRFMASLQFQQRLSALPEGLPVRMRPGLESIRRLMGDQNRVVQLMQELETEVVERSIRSGEPLEVSREAVLSAWEGRHGFKPAADLPVRLYGQAEWRAMLREGAMFKDTAFKDAQRRGNAHGYETHRLQWNLVMREMEARPAGFGEVSRAADYFKFLGEIDDATLDWRNSGIGYNSTVWFELFDSTRKNFGSPEFFRDQHAYFPGLGRWN